RILSIQRFLPRWVNSARAPTTWNSLPAKGPGARFAPRFRAGCSFPHGRTIRYGPGPPRRLAWFIAFLHPVRPDDNHCDFPNPHATRGGRGSPRWNSPAVFKEENMPARIRPFRPLCSLFAAAAVSAAALPALAGDVELAGHH